ncbi:dihydroorotase [Crystallibacter crystallopoietes]|uniref:dihydroorotase n=1 Tax=Crystallibacter crystallopoietes TaxID=37928 RepID=UPI0005C1EB94|nr:amidohydrolase family protein [Arthrobacter crystallopoietes]
MKTICAADHVIVGTVKLPDGKYGLGAVWIADGKVLQITPGVPGPDATGSAHVTDVQGAYVLPGAIDAHVHCYSHDGEGMLAATRAAAAGGVTTIVEMPFDRVGPVKDASKLLRKREIVSREAVTDVALLGTLWPGGGWREAQALAEAGAVGFKVSLFHTDTERFPRVDDAELLNVMAAVTDVDLTLCVHAENNEIVQNLSRIEQESNPYDPLTHVRTRPPVSESLGVLTAMEIAHDRGTRLHLCHMSIPRAVQLAAFWREDGADISLETCPHYLTFTAADMKEQHGRLKINPPLREREHVEGLWQGIGDGLVPVLSSDHAPWPLSLKDDPEILKNASGAPGVQTLAVVTLGQALARDPEPSGLFDRTVSALTAGPAERFGFADRKGRLEPGYDADIMVFRPDAGYTVSDEEQFSNAGWTPYAGMNPGGYMEKTFLRGRLIWDASTGVVAQPSGELVTRS